MLSAWVKRVAGLIGMALLSAGTVAHAEPSAPIHYGFQTGQKLGYRVQIASTSPDWEVSHSGLICYEVLSAGDQQFVLSSSGNLSNQQRQVPKPEPSQVVTGQRPTHGIPGMPWPRIGPLPDNEDEQAPNAELGYQSASGPNQWTLTRQGEIVRNTPDAQLPDLLGPQTLLIVDPLPVRLQTSWNRTAEVPLWQNQEQSMFPAMPRHSAPSPRNAKRTCEYRVLSQSPVSIRIAKRETITCPANDEKQKAYAMSGTGDLDFDMKKGVLFCGSMKYKLETTFKGKKVETTVTLDYRLVDEAEMADIERRQQEGRAVRRESPLPREEIRTAEELLQDLRSFKVDVRRKALEQLIHRQVREAQDEEISAALVPLLKDPDSWLRGMAAEGLKVWATANAEPALIRASRSEEGGVRRHAVAALGRIPSPAAAEAAAAQFPRDSWEARDALTAMGPMAEGAALPWLNDKNWPIRHAACEVLEKIGGRASLGPLEEAEQKFPEMAVWTRKARTAIEDRLGGASDRGAPAATPPSATSVLRTWRDTSGKFELEAYFISLEGTQVLLKRRDGRNARIALEQLSAEDQAWLKAHAPSPFREAPR